MRPERSEVAALFAVAYHALCVPSMGTVLMGFKSPVYKTMKRKTPAEANCGRATDRGKEG